MENLQNIGAATERLSELRAIRPKIIDGPGAEIPAGALALAFEDVHFRLQRRRSRCWKTIDFELKPGTVLGLLGRTGSRQDHPGAAGLPPVRPDPRAASTWAACR